MGFFKQAVQGVVSTSPLIFKIRKMKKRKFEIIRVSGVAVGVGFREKLKDGSGFYSENICETLYDTGNDEKDAAESEKWAKIICDALNNETK
jgi:hypothetical protein